MTIYFGKATLLAILIANAGAAMLRRSAGSPGQESTAENAVQGSNLTEAMTWCFEPRPQKSHPVDESMCKLALDSIIKRDGIENFRKVQTFWQGKDAPEGVHITPDRWVADLGPDKYCEIIIQGDKVGAIEQFRLLDIAAGAQAVLNECIGPGKFNLGGGSDIGEDNTFAVYVIGSKYKGEDPLVNSTDLATTVHQNQTSSEEHTASEVPATNDDLSCSQPGAADVWPVDADTCVQAQEFIIRRDGPSAFMKQQVFRNGPGAEFAFHITPDRWALDLEDHYCEIKLTAKTVGAIDKFSLRDVAAKAKLINDQCVRGSKTNLGGVADVGTKGFYVAINGRKQTSLGNSTGGSPIISSAMSETPDLTTY